jgi:hypothetical protein
MREAQHMTPPAEEKAMELVAISLWQPWASLWLSPAKIHETRHWPTRNRGWILVHAAKRKPDDLNCCDELSEVTARVLGNPPTLPLGAIIGAVHLIDCVRTETFGAGYLDTDDGICGDFSDERYAWKRGDYRVFNAPVPYRGSQGFFRVARSIVPEMSA